ncbi:hypothetical protein [Streptomyces sp. NBC_01237]|uniref:hypothetical protein n=1 Tax=Streptomyces sp. NBC_01237 TaxID=2903790 RepID=UPI002DDA099E|nr:hypothetical protein [Streptomyces sp. NBC_01237]WRZ77223.1 hypothetical protein OG251_36815 [Streptomyces sp. NBC_01237]
MPRLALHGRPGAGKSTLAGMLVEELCNAGAQPFRLKVGAPLYELQALVRAAAGRPLLNRDDQDGELLNCLGLQMRRINPAALTDQFVLRVKQAEQLYPRAVLLCDDVRGPDADVVSGLGFRMVHVAAPDEVRRARKAGRRDLSAGDDNHPTEEPVTAGSWRCVENDGDLDALRARAKSLVAEVLR